MEKKHLTRFFMLAVAAGTLFGACQKEDLAAVEDDFDMTGRIRLYAEKTSSASGAKLVADDTENPHKFKWYDGDQIKINGIDDPVTVNHSSFAADALNGAPDDIIAVYPASICDNSTFSNAGSITVTIPHEIEYREGGIEVPMMAYTSKEDALENGLSFKHLASVLAVRVSNGTTNDITMGSIEVSLGSGNYPIAGTWTVTYNGTGDGLDVTNTPKNGISYDEGYSNKITMTFPTPCVITNSEPKYFFFPIFSIREAGGQSSSAKFTIKVRATDSEGNACNFEKTQANNTRAIDRGQIAYAPVALDASTNTHSFFLVDDYYEIATGNLAYNVTTGEWSFLPYNVATVEDDSWEDDGSGEHQGVGQLMSCFLYGYAEHPTYLGYDGSTMRDIPSAGLSGVTDWGYQAKDDIGEGWTTPTSAQWEALLGQGNAKHWAEVPSGFLSDVNIAGYIVVPNVITFFNDIKNAGDNGVNNTYLSSGNLTQDALTLSLALSDLRVTYRTYEFITEYGAIFIPKGVATITSYPGGNGIDNSTALYNASDHCHYNLSGNAHQKDEGQLETDWVVSAPVRLIRKVNN